MYRVKAENEDKPISIALPEALIKDLVHRSQENGREINTEIAIRLARSLEKDSPDITDGQVIQHLINSKKS